MYKQPLVILFWFFSPILFIRIPTYNKICPIIWLVPSFFLSISLSLSFSQPLSFLDALVFYYSSFNETDVPLFWWKINLITFNQKLGNYRYGMCACDCASFHPIWQVWLILFSTALYILSYSTITRNYESQRPLISVRLLL